MVSVGDRNVWAYDNPHDVVMAHLVEVSPAFDVSDEIVARWRIWASIGDLGFSYNPDVSRDVLVEMLSQVRERVVARGSIGEYDLVGWKVYEDRDVSGGFVRGTSIGVDRILDVVDGLRDMLNGTLASPPPGTWWFLGTQDGRSTIGMATEAPPG